MRGRRVRAVPPAGGRFRTAIFAGIAAGTLMSAAALPDAVARDAAPRSDGPSVRVVHAQQVLTQANDPDADVMTQAVVAANPSSPRTAVVVSEEGENAGSSAGIRYASTTDAGRTWHARTLRNLTVASGGSWDRVAFATVATGVGRDAYVATAVRSGDCTTAIAVVHSGNGGRTFGHTALTGRSTTCQRFNVKPWVAVDTNRGSAHFGRVYLSVLVFHLDENGDDTGQQQFVQYSDDRGRTWSRRLALTSPSAFTHYNTVVVQPDGAVTVVYGQFRATDPPNVQNILARTSRDGGQSFAEPSVVTRNVIGFTGTADTRCCMPVVAVDPVTGRLYVPLMDIRFRDDDINDVLVLSSADGEEWGSPVLATPGDRGKPLEHFTPSIGAYAGTVYVSWTLRGATATALSDRIRQQVAVSTNGGRTYGPPVTVGGVGDLDFAGPAPNGFAPRFLSDYNTTVAVPHRAYSAWPLPTSSESGAAHQTVWAATVTSR